jgi:hypothetical protein
MNTKIDKLTEEQKAQSRKVEELSLDVQSLREQKA